MITSTSEKENTVLYFLILLDVTLREQNIHVNNVFCNWHSRRLFLQDLSLLNLASRISF